MIVGFDQGINYYKIQYAQLCINENPVIEHIFVFNVVYVYIFYISAYISAYYVAAVIVGFDQGIFYYKTQYAQLCINENPVSIYTCILSIVYGYVFCISAYLYIKVNIYTVIVRFNQIQIYVNDCS